MPELIAEGGSRPAMPTYFLRKKVGKEPAPMPPTLRFAAGNLRRQALGAVRQNSLRAFGAPFKQLPQVRSRSVCTLRCSRQPQELAVAGVVTRGNTGCGIASLSILIAVTAISDWARSQFHHLSRRPSAPAPSRVDAPAARGSGCGQRCRRTALLRALTCRRLFERSGVPRSEFGGTAE